METSNGHTSVSKLLRHVGRDVATIIRDELKLARTRFGGVPQRVNEQGLNHDLFMAKDDLDHRIHQLRDLAAKRAGTVRAKPGRAIALTALGLGVLGFLVGRRSLVKKLKK